MRQNSKRFRLDVWGWTTIVILLLYALFLLYPLSLLLKMAFSDGVHFTLENFAKFFSRKYYSITLLNSFKVSIAATIASVVVGVVLGYFMSVFKVRGAKLLRMCIVMATMSAPFVGAYAWIMLLGATALSPTSSPACSASPCRIFTASTASCWCSSPSFSRWCFCMCRAP